MIHIISGRMRDLPDALIKDIASRHAHTARDLVVVVPKQLTLDTENLLMERLGLPGSFRLRVMSPDRLCRAIFNEAGFPAGTRLDERGRAMLTHRVLKKCANKLSVYRTAWKKRGFADVASGELTLLGETGLTGDDLNRYAEEQSGIYARKIADLAVLIDEYRETCRGKYLDGTMEYDEATSRLADTSLVRDTDVWFYGFESTPPAMTRLIARMARLIGRVTIYYAIPDEENTIYQPIRSARDRLIADCRQLGADVRQGTIEKSEMSGAFRDIEERLFSDAKPDGRSLPSGVMTIAAKDTDHESRLVASLIRGMAAKYGWHWRDFLILTRDPEGSEASLSSAFRDAGIPLTLSDSRPASGNALASHLLLSLELIARSFNGDAREYLLAGFTGLSRAEGERLAEYAKEHGLTMRRLVREKLKDEDTEELRARATKPLVRLASSLKDAADLTTQLTAMFDFLTETECYAESLRLAQELEKSGEVRAANELRQVWNRVMGSLDQLNALMENERLPVTEIARLLRDSLDAIEIKTLPDSQDSVLSQPLGRPVSGSRKAVFVTGLSDSPAKSDDRLMTQQQRLTLAGDTHTYLGPGFGDDMLLRKCHLASAAGIAEEKLYFLYPMGDGDRSSLQPGELFQELKRLYPADYHLRGGCEGDAALEKALLSVPYEATLFAARAVRDKYDIPLEDILSALPEKGRDLVLTSAPQEQLDPSLALPLYGGLRQLSITQLETFARCPFSFFISYGLRPHVSEDMSVITPIDEGNFLHECMCRFTDLNRLSLGKLSEEDARVLMSAVVDEKLPAFLEGRVDPVQQARGRHLRDNAMNAASMLAWQALHSRFRVVRTETPFGTKQDSFRMTLANGACTLQGRIDRIDDWLRDAAGRYIRVIDYKLSGKKLDIGGVYDGTQLQLFVYLASALGGEKGLSAGVYYFSLGDGILQTFDRNPDTVHIARVKEYALSGLLPADVDVVKAVSDDLSVLGARENANGTISKATTSEADYRRLIRHTLKKAEEHLKDMKGGKVAVYPLRDKSADSGFGKADACRYCSYRPACLYDSATSPCREPNGMKYDEVMRTIIEEQAREDAPTDNN